MTDITKKLRQDARAFRERARQVRPHPQNPHKINAGDIARFVDVSCAFVAAELEEAADTIQSLTAKLERAKGALEQTIRLARNYAQKPTGSIFEEAILDAEQVLKDIAND